MVGESKVVLLTSDAHTSDCVGQIEFEIRAPHFPKPKPEPSKPPPQIYGAYEILNRCKNIFAVLVLYTALAAIGVPDPAKRK